MIYICDLKNFSQLNNIDLHTNTGQRKRRKIEEEKDSSRGLNTRGLLHKHSFNLGSKHQVGQWSQLELNS